MRYNLVKCHGCGNDFVIINGFASKLDKSKSYIKRLIIYLTDRSGPVGADGLIYLENSEMADARVTFYNPNGNSTKMCLNGIRCAARFIFDNIANEALRFVQIETDAGIIKVEKEIDSKRNMFFYTVDEITDIDLNANNVPIEINSSERVINQSLTFLSEEYLFTAIKVYTPHLVAVVDKIDEKVLYDIGIKANENSSIFPNGMNVSFVKFLNEENIFVRTFERDNIGMSLSCSSAMVAAVCVLIELNRLKMDTWINIYNKGGLIRAKCKKKDENNFCVKISGPATIVYTAEIEVDEVVKNLKSYVPMNEDDVSGLRIINGNVDMEEISRYDAFLSKTKDESKEDEFLLEMMA